jgi:hypothetical protein
MSNTHKTTDGEIPVKPLDEVLEKSKQVQAEVADAAEELQVVQTVLEKHIANIPADRTDVNQAVARTGEVSERLNQSAEKLTAVNEALEQRVGAQQQQLKK